MSDKFFSCLTRAKHFQPNAVNINVDSLLTFKCRLPQKSNLRRPVKEIISSIRSTLYLR